MGRPSEKDPLPRQAQHWNHGHRNNTNRTVLETTTTPSDNQNDNEKQETTPAPTAFTSSSSSSIRHHLASLFPFPSSLDDDDESSGAGSVLLFSDAVSLRKDDDESPKHTEDDSSPGGALSLAHANHNAYHHTSLQELERIATHDRRRIRRRKFLAVTVLVVVGTLLAFLTYGVLEHEEQRHFETSYDEIVQGAETHVRTLAAQLATALTHSATQLSAAAVSAQSPLPWYTAPTVEVSGQAVRQRAMGVELWLWAPLLVSVEQIQLWERYAVQHQGWLEISRRYHTADGEARHKNNSLGLTDNDVLSYVPSLSPLPTSSSVLNSSSIFVSPPNDSPLRNNNNGDRNTSPTPATADERIIPHIHANRVGNETPPSLLENVLAQYRNTNLAKADELSIMMAPLWQMSPPPLHARPVINLELLSSFESFSNASTVLRVRRRGHFSPLLGPNQHVPSSNDSVVQTLQLMVTEWHDHERYHRQLVEYHSGDGRADAFAHPHVLYWEPVFEEPYNPLSKLVGMIAAIITWDRYVVNLVPDNVDDIVCVVKNTCGQAATYLLNGNRPMLLDPANDVHDTAYDGTQRIIPFETFRGIVSEDDASKPSENECHYAFHFYASDSFQANYRSRVPVIFSVVVAAAVLLMIITFYLYDCSVHKRDRYIISVVDRATQVVTELFATAAQEKKDAESARQKMEQSTVVRDPEQARQSPPTETPLVPETVDSVSPSVTKASLENSQYVPMTPIADWYSSSTVMVAAIDGLDRWSARVEAAKVFALLHNVFQCMDEIADRRNILTVESSGDVYIAVAGAMDYRKSHVTAMCQFAQECLIQIKSLLIGMNNGAGMLQLKVGLHSGPVTAGIFQGRGAKKSRFRLLGDSVGVASNLQRNGEAGRLHASPETADLLINKKLGRWLTMRNEDVEALGSGERVTFWVQIPQKDKRGYASSETETAPTAQDPVRAATTPAKSRLPSHQNKSLAVAGGIRVNELCPPFHLNQQSVHDIDLLHLSPASSLDLSALSPQNSGKSTKVKGKPARSLLISATPKDDESEMILLEHETDTDSDDDSDGTIYFSMKIPIYRRIR